MFSNVGLTCNESDVKGKTVGDIIRANGKNYKITKKTRTAVAVKRWYWFDNITAKLLKTDKGGAMTVGLPTDAKERKNLPIGTGVLDYFPLALAEVARVSKVGNDQHNGPGTPLHWDRSKSTDESDALIRHFLERDKKDSDGTYHAAKMIWRGCAYLQRMLEDEKDKEKQGNRSA